MGELFHVDISMWYYLHWIHLHFKKTSRSTADIGVSESKALLRYRHPFLSDRKLREAFI